MPTNHSTQGTQENRPPEVRLLLLLCRHPAADVDTAELCSKITDWQLFLKLASHHRVTSLVARNLGNTPVPDAVRQELRSQTSRNAIEAFRYLSELQRILNLLSASAIEATVIKGVPLSIQAFGDLATRYVGDIDLLIDLSQAESADTLLQANGFIRKDPAADLTPRRRTNHANHFKDYTYEPEAMQAHGGFEIDLHWRLFRNPCMPGNDLSDCERELVQAGPLAIRTLPRSRQMLYLAVQGAVDGWSSFKSVADIAAMWNSSDKAETLEQARAEGVLPYLFAALLLADSWIGGLALPEHFRLDGTLKHPLTRRIVEHALQRMQGYLPAVRDRSSWSAKRYEASLHNSSDYKLEIVRRVLFRPRVWTRFDLPDALFPLYPLLSPVEWLLFHAAPTSERDS